MTLAGALLATVLSQRGQRAGAGFPELLTLSLQGLFILAGVQLLLHLRRQTWRSLALTGIRQLDLLRALQAFGLMFVFNVFFMVLMYAIAPSLVKAHQERLSEVANLVTGHAPFAAVVATMLFVGFYEEVLARGFLLKRCQGLLGGHWGPVLMSAALFGLGHFYQGMLGMLQTALMGIVFASLALKWQTLWPLILAHALLNTLSLALMRQLETSAGVAL